MAAFKVPQTLPQDLLLISEFVDVPEKLEKPRHVTEDDGNDIASSGSDEESEEEIEKVLTALPENEEEDDGKSLPSDSSSSSDSESESELEETGQSFKPKAASPDIGDDEDTIPTTAAHPQTANEVLDVDITIPDLEEVTINEQLEKVGELMSIVNNIAIVKGLPSEYANVASDRALDSDTLLVFEDRKVMGYVYETFGPTSQPLYQVRFNQKYPLSPEKVRIGREVFHVPQRSHFVFVKQLRQLKGSDASNVHDEEPAEEELEFSDDEAEAAYRSRFKRKRGQSRTRSAPSSRHSTPSLSQMRDQDMMDQSILNKSPFDEHGPYDLDYGGGPSRPAPKPYDDPYSEAYNEVEYEDSSATRPRAEPERPTRESRSRSSSYTGDGGGRRRGRGRGKRGTNTRGTFTRDNHYPPPHNLPTANDEEYDPRMPYGTPPHYLQGQNNYGQGFTMAPQHTNTNADPTWSYQNQAIDQLRNQPSHMFPGPAYHLPYVQPSTFVQPHINPRFASAFGLGVATNPAAYTQASRGPMTPPYDWAGQWPTSVSDPPAPTGEEPTS